MSDSVNTTELHQFGADYSYFCTKAAEFTGINLHNYKEGDLPPAGELHEQAQHP